MAAKGNPFWNQQGVNVYFGVFGNQDWGQNWNNALKNESIIDILRRHPIPFAKNMANNFVSVLKLDLLPQPYALLTWPSVLLALNIAKGNFDKQYSMRFLTVISSFIYCFAICAAFINHRLLLFVTLLLSLFFGYGIASIPPILLSIHKFKIPF